MEFLKKGTRQEQIDNIIPQIESYIKIAVDHLTKKGYNIDYTEICNNL